MVIFYGTTCGVLRPSFQPQQAGENRRGMPPSARPSRVVVVLPPLIGNLENDAPACSSIPSASPTLQDQPRFACVAGLERIRAELCNQQRPPACQWPDGVADVRSESLRYNFGRPDSLPS